MHWRNSSMDGSSSSFEGDSLMDGVKKAMPPEKLTELALFDPKRAKRMVVEKYGDLVCQLIFEHETREELEAASNQDDMRDPECNIGGVNIQESIDFAVAAVDKDDGAKTDPDLNKMTLTDWLDYLERHKCLRK